MNMTQHHGIFRKEIRFSEGVALITSGTIGAGILSIPFVVAQTGMTVGVLEIVSVGLLMIGLNLLLGEMAFASGLPLQLPGLAGRYLGKWGKWGMALLTYILLLGALMVYIIGEGDVLSALFGGSPFLWSSLFFVFGFIFVLLGLRTVKLVELLLTLGILAVVVAIAFWSFGEVQLVHWEYTNLAHAFLPLGVLIFAFHGTTSVPEAYSILPRDYRQFQKVVGTAGMVVMAVYALFTFAVVGVTGFGTTEIATIGLGRALGQGVFLAGNIFAALAMGTSFLMAGVAMRDSLVWDFKMNTTAAAFLVCGIPFIVFLAGERGFVSAINLIGGFFMPLEIALILLMYIRMKIGKSRLSTPAS